MAIPTLVIAPLFQAHNALAPNDIIASGSLTAMLYTLIITELIAIIAHELQRGNAIEDRNNKVASARKATRLSLESALTGLILCAPGQRRKGANDLEDSKRRHQSSKMG